MGAAKIFLGTHIQVIMVIHVQHGINSGDRRYADWSWRKTWIYVCIIGAMDVEQIIIYAFEREIFPCELNSWVGLQGHSFRIFSIS